MDINERLDFLEFKMDLLFEDTNFSRFIYEYNINKEQLRQLYDVMDKYRGLIRKGEEVHSAGYEKEILDIVRNDHIDYHFCESFAQILWEQRRYAEVFEALYKDSPKFSDLFESK